MSSVDYFWLLLLWSISTLTFMATEKSFKDLKLIFVNGPTPNQFEYIQLNETSKLLKHPYFHNDRPTMLYGFGYTEKYTSMSTQTVVSSYILRGDHNILVVEWSKYSDGFFDSIPNTNKVGAIVGKTLLTMNENGFNLSSFHLVGHSLGGHLVGFIGRSVFENSNKKFKLSRVTALDPAGPFFYGFGKISEPLKSDDAIFVDVIHTDSTFFGAPVATGTVDFWPNEGRNQPNCPPPGWNIYNENNFCSHRRSWAYYSESVRTIEQKTFNCVSCSSWESFTVNKCEKSNGNLFMGIDADSKMKGNYYLQTNDKARFNRGANGTTYKKDGQRWTFN